MKRTDLKKLQLKTTTIRVLKTNHELKAVVGGLSAGCDPGTKPSVREPWCY